MYHWAIFISKLVNGMGLKTGRGMLFDANRVLKKKFIHDLLEKYWLRLFQILALQYKLDVSMIFLYLTWLMVLFRSLNPNLATKVAMERVLDVAVDAIYYKLVCLWITSPVMQVCCGR